MSFLRLTMAVWLLSIGPAVADSGSAISRLAAVRGGEAMDLAVQLDEHIWPLFDPEDLSLMIVQPGSWTVLINHPDPPSEFKPADPVPRRRVDAVTGNESYDGAQGAVWSVHQGGPGTLPGLAWAASGVSTLNGRAVAIVEMNEISRTVSWAPGWPPAESTIARMLRTLWLARMDRLEGPLGASMQTWNYDLDARGLALAGVEQRLLLVLTRLSYNEETLDRYHELAAMWVAVREERARTSPGVVAMEEQIERRLGLADFTETSPLRVLAGSGAAVRPNLDDFDPFFERYKGFFLHRVNVLNAPMTIYPATPLQALQKSSATGAGLGLASWPLSVRWSRNFFSADRSTPRKTLREVIAGALVEKGVPLSSGDKGLLDRALERTQFDELARLMPGMLEEEVRAARVRESLAHPEGLPRLSIDLAGTPLTSLSTPLERQAWLGPGRVLVSGPVRLEFPGGELAAEGKDFIFQAGDGAVAGQDRGPRTISALLPRGWHLEGSGKRLSSLPGDGQELRIQAPLELASPGLRLGVGKGEAVLSGSGIRIRALSLNETSSSGGNQN